MKKILLGVMLVMSGVVQAEPVGLQFREVKIPALVEGVLKNILHLDYVMAPEAAKLDTVVNVSVRVERSAVLDVLRQTLAGAGLGLEDRAGVLYVGKVHPVENGPVAVSSVQPMAGQVQTQTNSHFSNLQDTDTAVYFPRYRPADLLAWVAKSAGANVPESKLRPDMVVYSGTPEVLARIARVLVAADQPATSVHVKAVLLEVSNSNESARSINILFTALKGKLAGVLDVGKLQSNAISWSGVDLQAVLSAVEGDSRFRSLAEPSMRVLDGETARLVVGADVPIRGATVVSNGQSIQGVEYRTSGVVIQIEPRIQRDSIILKISQSVSDFGTTTTSGIDSPTMQKREAQTTIEAVDGEIIVIAGMDQNKESDTSAGLSFLPSFMRSKTTNSSKSQMLLLLEVKRLNSGLSRL